MKNIVSILVLLFCLCIQGVGAIEKPQALIKNPTWNFGFVPQKSKISHTFYLYNIGTLPLNVLKIKSGCSCTSVSRIKEPIAPGDSAAIVITFNTGRYHRKTGKTTTIFTDDPDSSTLFVDILADVQKNDEPTGEVVINPRKLLIKIDEDGAIVDSDSPEIKNIGSNLISVKVLHVSENIINRIGMSNVVTPEETLYPKLSMTEAAISDDMKGESITFGFVGRDTVIVTVPIEIKK